MFKKSREAEKNPMIIVMLAKNYKDFFDLKNNHLGQALEGTGSLIFDSFNKKVYCSLSERADRDLTM